jgi:hypothetical protein
MSTLKSIICVSGALGAATKVPLVINNAKAPLTQMMLFKVDIYCLLLSFSNLHLLLPRVTKVPLCRDTHPYPKLISQKGN